VLVLGLLAVALAVLAGLQVVATRLPALVVVLLAAQFLAACSGPVTPGQIAWTALEAAALWAVHGCFGLGDVVARATDVRSSALRRCVWRTLSISLVATPLVVIVIVLGHAGRDESWLRVAGPLAALAALGALAAQLRLTRWRRNR
jgi:hypothetical protein